MELEFLKSLVVIFGTSAFVILVLHRIKIPSIVGFLIAGALVGPYGLRLVTDVHAIEMLAEIGVILLLFTIGIEFSMTKLMRIKKAVIGGGGLQVLLTIGAAGVATYLSIGNVNTSVFFGFMIALSSTAIVLKMLAETGETDSPHGRVMVGILIFQDLCVVPLMLLTPVLAGDSVNIMDIVLRMGKAALIIVIVLFSARWIVPLLLHQVVHTKSRELFIITIILICLGIALLTSQFGLSLALGAFLAGLIISESEYSAQALSDILPFKDSFIGLFFVSIGMLMNLGYFTDHHLHIELVVFVIFMLKVLTGTVSAFLIGNPLRTSLHAGLSLAQVGEFSFVLAVAGKSAGLLTEDLYQIFLSSSVITMLLTPFMIKVAPSLASKITSFSFLQKLCDLRSENEKSKFHSRKHGHVIIVGFGLNGKNLARVLRQSGIPYVVLEMNSDTVREMRKKGEPIFYGDGTSRELLHNLNITKARLLVIAISDPASTRSIVSIARRENPDLYIIVRTRYLIEVDDLTKLGANEVIPEEFETSVEIFSRVLNQYQIPQNVISDHIDAIRMDSYKVLRSVELPQKRLTEQHKFLEGVETETYLIKDDSNIDGHSVKDLRLRTETGVTVIAVQRGEIIHHNPSPDFVFRKQDIILLIGKRKDIQIAREYLDSDRFVIEKYQR